MLAIAITFDLSLNNHFDNLRQFRLYADSCLSEPFTRVCQVTGLGLGIETMLGVNVWRKSCE